MIYFVRQQSKMKHTQIILGANKLKNVVFYRLKFSFLSYHKKGGIQVIENDGNKGKNLSKTTATKMNKFRKRISTKVSQTKFIFFFSFYISVLGFSFFFWSILEASKQIQYWKVLCMLSQYFLKTLLLKVQKCGKFT